MTSRKEGIIDRLSEAEQYSDVSWILDPPIIENLALSVVVSKQRRNMEFQAKAGLPARVKRYTVGYCCEWCAGLVGEYQYPDVPENVWHRHTNCNCRIDYTPAGGGRVDRLKGRRYDQGWELADTKTLEERKTFTGVEVNTENKQKPALMQRAIASDVKAVPVRELETPLSETEIIERLGGGDQTRGSCASLANAYAANKKGYDVLDFRGGKSCEFWSRRSNSYEMLKDIAGAPTETVVAKSDVKAAKTLLAKMEPDTEYMIQTGRHMSVVKVDDEGVYWYLELQDVNPGWREFSDDTTSTLVNRFGCRKTSKYERPNHLTKIDDIKPNEEYRELLEYINTNPGKQRKGSTGYAK